MNELKDSYTSTGEKLFWHQEAMQKLRDGFGTPISAWCAPTDVCNFKCGYCSVGNRPGDVLPWSTVKGFIDQLVPLGLKSITYSGGGNVLLYKCKETGKDCNDLVSYAHDAGLEVAVITNGMPLREYPGGRKSWKTMAPETLDKLTWCRLSLAGLDYNHQDQGVNVPDFDQTKTSLGFSWIMSDLIEEKTHKHGWVSTPEDIVGSPEGRKTVSSLNMLAGIEDGIRQLVQKHNPTYCRLLANCLQPDMIPVRHKLLSEMANRINPEICFSQHKPPSQPKKNCAKIYTRPCLNADGWVYCCDSVVLNRSAGHKFGSDWRVVRWDEIGKLFSEKIRQVIPNTICPGCVFADQVNLIGQVVEGWTPPVPTGEPMAHLNFV